MRVYVPFVLAVAVVVCQDGAASAANVEELVSTLGQEAETQTVVLNVRGMS